MKKLLFVAGSAVALASVSMPAVAQDEAEGAMTEADMADAMAGFAELYPAEPLTAEQEARLPTARRVVSYFMPEGAMVEMMDSMFGGIIAPLAETEINAGSALEAALGHMVSSGDMEEADVIATLAIVDPDWESRNAAEAEAIGQMMTRMAEVMEPMMREVTSELYAIYFTQAQLEDIEVFFRTETGAAYARSSWQMSSDPRIMSRMFSNEAMWQEMFNIEEMEAEMEAVSASRTYEELSSAERSRVLELTGLTDEELRAGISTEFEYTDEYWEEEMWDAAEDAGEAGEEAGEGKPTPGAK